MNRLARRAQASTLRALKHSRPSVLTRMSDEELRDAYHRAGTSRPPIEVWMSRDWLVQIYPLAPSEGQQPGLLGRMTVNRVTTQSNGRTHEGILWDDLQRIKREIGRGEQYAIEVYPRDSDLVDVASMRHLWLFDEPLDCGWFSGGTR